MWFRGSCCCVKAPTRTRRCRESTRRCKELNDHILPPGVKVVPFIDRSDLVHYTTHTVLHNLTEGIILVVIILFLFLGNVRGAIIVALTIPFSLLFAATCLNLKGIPANLLSLGALDFGMVVDGAVVMVENIVRHLGRRETETTERRSRRSSTPRTKCSGRCSTPSPSSSPPICRSSPCSAWKGDCSSPWPGPWRSLCWARLIFSMLVAPVLASLFFPQGHAGMAQPGDGVADQRVSQRCCGWAIQHALGDGRRWRCRPWSGDLSHCRRRDRFRVSAAPG